MKPEQVKKFLQRVSSFTGDPSPTIKFELVSNELFITVTWKYPTDYLIHSIKTQFDYDEFEGTTKGIKSRIINHFMDHGHR